MTKQVHRAKPLTNAGLRRLFLSAAVLLLLAILCVAPAAADDISGSQIGSISVYDQTVVYSEKVVEEGYTIHGYLKDLDGWTIWDSNDITWEIVNNDDGAIADSEPIVGSDTFVIKVLKTGTVIINASATDFPSVYKKFKVDVVDPVVTSISLSTQELFSTTGSEFTPVSGSLTVDVYDQQYGLISEPEISIQNTDDSVISVGTTPVLNAKGSLTYSITPKKKGTATITVTSGEMFDEITIYVVEASPELTVDSPAPIYEDGSLSLSGTYSGTNSLYLYLVGGDRIINLMLDTNSPGIVSSDGTWSVDFTADALKWVLLNPGTYLVCVSEIEQTSYSLPASELAASRLGSTELVVKAAAPVITEISGDKITGTAHVSDSVRYYIFGTNSISQGTSTVDSDGTFTITDVSIPKGEYAVIVHEPMYDGKYNITIGESDPYPVMKIPEYGDPYLIFNITDKSSYVDSASELYNIYLAFRGTDGDDRGAFVSGVHQNVPLVKPTTVVISATGYPADKILDLNGVYQGTLTAVVKSETGEVLKDEEIIWKSGDETSLTINANGEYTALPAGKDKEVTITAVAAKNPDAKAEIIFKIIDTTQVQPVPTPVQPILPITEPVKENQKTTITVTDPSKVILSDDGNTATITASNTGVTLHVTFQEKQTDAANLEGTVIAVVANYEPASAVSGNSVGGAVSYGLNLVLTDATSALPMMDATIKESVVSVLNSVSGLNIAAMVTAETNVDSIDALIKDGSTVSFTVPAAWYNSMTEIWYYHVKDGSIVGQGKVTTTTVNGDGTVTLTVPVNGFSTYAIGGKVIQQQSSNNGGGSSSGSSTWLTSTSTPTPTGTPTATPSETAPTDVPTGEPTPTQTQSPGFGVLAVLAGLGAVAVLRRK